MSEVDLVCFAIARYFLAASAMVIPKKCIVLNRSFNLFRAPESIGSHDGEAVHAIDECIQQKGREPRGSGCTRLLRVRLHQDPQHATHDARDGRSSNGAALGSERPRSSAESVRTGAGKSCVISVQQSHGVDALTD